MKKSKKTQFLLTFLIILLLGNVSMAQHFSPVWSGNPYNPMSIIIQKATLDGVDLSSGDEIAVFDIGDGGKQICVGSVVLSKAPSSSQPVTITAGQDDNTTSEIDGFTSGHKIIFKYWIKSSAKEVPGLTATYNLSFDTAYTNLGTAVVTSLSGYSPVETSIDTLTTCPGIISLPINVKKFTNIKSFSVQLIYDSAYLRYTGYQNKNTQLNNGTFTIQNMGNLLEISWNTTSVSTITSGPIVELNFTASQVYNKTITQLNWDSANSYYENNNGVHLGTVFHDGTITILPVPEPAGPIDGPDSICIGNQTQLYHIGLIKNATDYNWSLSPDSAGTLTKNDTSATIHFSDTFSGKATLYVFGSNSCGNGDTSLLNIAVLPNPSANAGTDDTICENADYTLSGTAINNKSVFWKTLGDGSFDKPNSLTSTYTPGKKDISAGKVKLVLTTVALLPCGINASDTIQLTLARYPEKPAMPDGPTTILLGQNSTSTYKTNRVNNADVYTWYLVPSPDAGIIAGNDTTGTVTWNDKFTDTKAYVYVIAENAVCGKTSSDSLEVRTSPVGIEKINPGKFHITIAPNPSGGRFKIILNNVKEDMELYILNQTGQMIKKVEMLKSPSGKVEQTINMTVYPPGIYFLRFSDGRSIITKRIIIR